MAEPAAGRAVPLTSKTEAYCGADSIKVPRGQDKSHAAGMAAFLFRGKLFLEVDARGA